MTKSISSAPSNRPDTSPQAVARVLRECVKMGNSLIGYIQLDGDRPQGDVYCLIADCRALADALDALAAQAAVTWQDRVERALVPLPWYDTTSITLTRKTVEAALRLSFPELAPSDD